MNHGNSELNIYMDKVLSEGGTKSPTCHGLILGCGKQIGRVMQDQTFFPWLHQRPPNVGTPHCWPVFCYVHVSFIYIFEDLLSALGGTWEAQIGSKPSQAQRIKSEQRQEI